MNAKAVGPEELPVQPPKLGLTHHPTVLLEVHWIIKLVWHQRKVPQWWRDVVMNILHKKKDKAECGNYRGISLAAHAGEDLVKGFATRLGTYCEAKGLLPEEQCGFLSHCPTTDMIFVVRMVQS